jgi:hypothetical protein
MKNGLATFLAIIFGAVLGLTLVAFIANATILKPQTVVSAIPDEAYPAMAKGLPQALGQLTPLSKDEKLILVDKIDPSMMRQISRSVVEQEIGYLHGNGRTPQIDLRELSGQLRAEGAPLPQTLYDQLDRPIPLKTSGANQSAVATVSWLDHLRTWGLIFAIVLAVLIWLLGAHYRYRSLAKGAVTAVIVLGISLLVVGAIPSLASSGLSTSQLAALAEPIKSALKAVTRSYNHDVTNALLGLVAAAMALLVVHVLFGRQPKHHR